MMSGSWVEVNEEEVQSNPDNVEEVVDEAEQVPDNKEKKEKTTKMNIVMSS